MNPWICPRCDTVNAPWMPTCANASCGKFTISTGTTIWPQPQPTGPTVPAGRCMTCGGQWAYCRGNHTVA